MHVLLNSMLLELENTVTKFRVNFFFTIPETFFKLYPSRVTLQSKKNIWLEICRYIQKRISRSSVARSRLSPILNALIGQQPYFERPYWSNATAQRKARDPLFQIS
jgi:hypothetical protein